MYNSRKAVWQTTILHSQWFHREKHFCLFASPPRSLHRWASADPVPVTPKRAPTAVNIVVLSERGQSLLIGVEVQPAIQDTGCVSGLKEPAANQGPVDQVLHGYDTGAISRDGSDRVCEIRL